MVVMMDNYTLANYWKKISCNDGIDVLQYGICGFLPIQNILRTQSRCSYRRQPYSTGPAGPLVHWSCQNGRLVFRFSVFAVHNDWQFFISRDVSVFEIRCSVFVYSRSQQQEFVLQRLSTTHSRRRILGYEYTVTFGTQTHKSLTTHALLYLDRKAVTEWDIHRDTHMDIQDPHRYRDIQTAHRQTDMQEKEGK